NPNQAFDRLSSARQLNPLGDQADVLAGVIARRLGRVGIERTSFERAAQRNPLNWYAHLELAILDAQDGRRALALDRLDRAIRLKPGEPVLRSVRARIKRGKSINQAAVDKEFADRAAILTKTA